MLLAAMQTLEAQQTKGGGDESQTTPPKTWSHTHSALPESAKQTPPRTTFLIPTYLLRTPVAKHEWLACAHRNGKIYVDPSLLAVMRYIRRAIIEFIQMLPKCYPVNICARAVRAEHINRDVSRDVFTGFGANVAGQVGSGHGDPNRPERVLKNLQTRPGP